MTIDQFMNYLFIALAIGAPLFILGRFLKDRLPRSSFTLFQSINEVTKYYAASIRIIRAHRWLLFLPLTFALLPYAINLVILIKQREQIQMLTNYMSPESANDVAAALMGKQVVLQIIEGLFLTPQTLSYGYVGAIGASSFYLLCFALCSLAFKIVIGRLRRFEFLTAGQSINYLEQIFRISFFLVVVLAALLIKSAMEDHLSQTMMTIISVGITIVFPLLMILSISLLSVIEGFILFTVRDALTHAELNFSNSLDRALSVLKPLFLFNVLIGLVAYMPSLLSFPNTLAMFFSSDPGPLRYSSALINLSKILTFINSAVTTFTFCIPFVMIFGNFDIRNSFKKNLSFIANHLLKYLAFVSVGVLLLFIPYVVENIISAYLGFFSFYRLSVATLFHALKVLLAVAFYIAAFGFYLDFNQEQHVIA